jgi:hypothetical protein
MNILNPWVGYLSRSYQQIKDSIINRLKTATPEITDLGESNILIIILGFFAGIAETLHYYIDSISQEAFIETAREKESIMKILKSQDRRIRANIAAYVDLKLSFKDGDGNPIALTSDLNLLAGHQFSTDDNLTRFELPYSIKIPMGESIAIIKVRQFKSQSSTLGVATSAPNQKYYLPDDYAHDTLTITIKSEDWNLKDTLAYSLPDGKDYIVDVDDDGIYVKFGDNVFGQIPNSGYNILANYKVTRGSIGNTIQPNTITISVDPLSAPGAGSTSITNTLKPTGASDVETLEALRFRGPLALRTLDRAVTVQDYEDLLSMHPAVLKGTIEKTSSVPNMLKMYVVPVGGGLVPSGLYEELDLYFDKRKIIGRRHNIRSAGISLVYVIIEAEARFNQEPSLLENRITSAILNKYSYENKGINDDVRKSEIIAAAQNVNGVDFIKTCTIWVKPYARPLKPDTPELDISLIVKPTATEKINWVIKYTGSGYFLILKNSTQNVILEAGDTFSDETLEFIINTYSYDVGDTWQFTSYPYNQDADLDDYTLPIARLESITTSVDYKAKTLNTRN